MAGKHTAGPWAHGHDGHGAFSIETDNCDGVQICYVRNEANARLIAAAPDLLNALTVLANAAESRGIPVDAARAAIARATQPPPPQSEEES